MMENEEPFAIEAQDEAILSRTRSLQLENGQRAHTLIGTEEDHPADTESSPLISRADGGPRSRLSRASKSYERAIAQPWTGAQGSSSIPWYKRPSLPWLLVPFLPFCIAFGGTLVPKQYLILNLVCQDYLSDRSTKDPSFHFLPVIFGEQNDQCRIPGVQSRVARFQLYMNLCVGIFSAIVSPQLGALSDRVGRNKVICIGSFGAILAEIITIWVGTHPGTVSVYWIIFGSFLDGLSGSFTAAMAVAFAYAADCTAPERRNVSFGYFHATLFAGIAFGPVIAGLIIKATGDVMNCFYVALGAHVLFVLFILLVTPESLSKERQAIAREKFRLKKQAMLDNTWLTSVKNYNLLEPLWVLRPKGPGSSSQLRKNLVLLASVDTIMFGVAMGTMGIIVIYCEYKFGWDAYTSSMFMSAVNICRVTGLVVVLPLLTRRFRRIVKGEPSVARGADMLDINVIRAALVFDVMGYLGYALAPSGAILVTSGMIASLGGMGSPSLQSSLTKSVPPDRAGQMLGATGLLHALARVVAPTIFSLIYSETVGIFAGIVFLCLGSVFMVAFVLSWFLRPHLYLNEPSTPEVSEEVDDVTR